MKIGYIMSYGVFAPTNGIVSQALTWKKGLEFRGHTVILVNMFDKNDWQSFDAIHFFGFSVYMSEFIKVLYKANPNIAVSPIFDPGSSVLEYYLYSHWGSSKLRLTNPYYALRQVRNLVKWFFVRSEFEKKYMIESFGVPSNKCHIVPLSFDFTPSSLDFANKENFCLHISLLCDDRKNVKRLIAAANKYKFKLVLGGKLRNEEEERLLRSWIGESTNVQYVGYLSENDKRQLYSKAKVFALPSINEGVGIVALEAAAFGCDVVLTKLGGPKYYYDNNAFLVDPFDIDEIGRTVKFVLDGQTKQPGLASYINKKYNLPSISALMENIYSSI